MSQPPPEMGALLRDVRRDRVGVVQALHAGRVYLRPQGGGREWAVKPEELQTITADEVLRLRAAEARQPKQTERANEQAVRLPV